LALLTNPSFTMDSGSPHDEEKGKAASGVYSHRIRRLVSLSKIVFPLVAILVASGDDPSSKMWILSITHADKHDSAMVERWKADMDGILIYVRF
jgi:hypothetical protein